VDGEVPRLRGVRGVKDWYVYTLESTAIKPKWCIVNLELVKWDISTDACIVTFVVTEFDEKEIPRLLIQRKGQLRITLKSMGKSLEL